MRPSASPSAAGLYIVTNLNKTKAACADRRREFLVEPSVRNFNAGKSSQVVSVHLVSAGRAAHLIHPEFQELTRGLYYDANVLLLIVLDVGLYALVRIREFLVALRADNLIGETCIRSWNFRRVKDIQIVGSQQIKFTCVELPHE